MKVAEPTYPLNLSPVHSLLERERQYTKYGRYLDDDVIGLPLVSGCFRGIEEAGFLYAFHQRNLLRHVDVVVGGSVGAVGAYCFGDFEKGLKLYPYLLQNHFLNLSNGDIRNVLKIVTQEVLERAHLRPSRIVNNELLESGLLQFGPEDDAAPSRVKRYSVATNAFTGDAVVHDLNSMPKDAQVQAVSGSSLLLGLAGNKPISVDSVPLVDNIFCNRTLVDVAVDDLKCTKLLMPCSAPPKEAASLNDSHRSMFLFFLRHYNPDAEANLDMGMARMKQVVQEMRERGSVMAGNGIRVPVTFMQTDDGEVVTRSTETDPKKLAEGFLRGYARASTVLEMAGAPATPMQIEAAEKMAHGLFAQPATATETDYFFINETGLRRIPNSPGMWHTFGPSIIAEIEHMFDLPDTVAGELLAEEESDPAFGMAEKLAACVPTFSGKKPSLSSMLHAFHG